MGETNRIVRLKMVRVLVCNSQQTPNLHSSPSGLKPPLVQPSQPYPANSGYEPVPAPPSNL